MEYRQRVCALPETKAADIVRVTVWDHDKITPDEQIGHVDFLKDLMPGQPIRKWYVLKDKQGVENKKLGHIKVTTY